MSDKKIRVGVLGATGMVGQRFITLLENHPWFEVTVVAASPRSAGKPYQEAVAGRWNMAVPIPSSVADLRVLEVSKDLQSIAKQVDLVFCALDLDKPAIQQIEIDYAEAGVPVVSNNSAHRWTPDVPMLIPEVNADHLALIGTQRKNRGWTTGLIAVKPNCSLQAYTSVITALKQFGPTDVIVTSLQAISGAGRTFKTWPEMADNTMPLPGEEEKSEQEPRKIWGRLEKGTIQPADQPHITATCIRVPTSDGHLSSVTVQFAKQVTEQEIMDAVQNYPNPLAGLDLPSAPKQFITYLKDAGRPQTRLDRGTERGMGITMGRLRQSGPNTWQFVAHSHNTIRGAAGGAILIAELLVAKKFIGSQ